jgi:hypothetical protein
MFQFGKVLKVLKPEDKEVDSSDKSVQAIVEMWDEVILACGIASNLGDKAKAGDFAVTEISPLSQNLFRHTIVKLVKGKTGLEAWNEYKKVYNKRKQDAEGQQMDSEMPKGRMVR